VDGAPDLQVLQADNRCFDAEWTNTCVLPGERIANADKECRDYNPKIFNMEEWHG